MTATFLNLPIEGDITRGTAAKPQRPLHEFQAIVAAALTQEGVTEFGWTQYTPYFNDGEPCVFGVHGLGHVVVDGVENEDGFPGYGDEEKRVMGEQPRRYVSGEGWVPSGPYVGPNQARYEALVALDGALSGGEFDVVLLELFGDHAEVRVVPGDAVHVEEYSHD